MNLVYLLTSIFVIGCSTTPKNITRALTIEGFSKISFENTTGQEIVKTFGEPDNIVKSGDERLSEWTYYHHGSDFVRARFYIDEKDAVHSAIWGVESGQHSENINYIAKLFPQADFRRVVKTSLQSHGPFSRVYFEDLDQGLSIDMHYRASDKVRGITWLSPTARALAGNKSTHQ